MRPRNRALCEWKGDFILATDALRKSLDAAQHGRAPRVKNSGQTGHVAARGRARSTRRTSGHDRTVGIIGAGTMGNGIAQVCAAAGLRSIMVDISDAAVARGHVDRRRQPRAPGQEGEDDGGRSRRRAGAHHAAPPTTPSSPICDLVIEAATENEELKVKILKDVCAIAAAAARWSPPTPRRSRSPSSPPRPTVRTASSACTSSIRCR